ncbi:MAG: hypothetical protein CL811_00475 [Colwelliaceae bacterium]|nr:hypothetical protein [Colwelliaceae bacterium]
MEKSFHDFKASEIKNNLNIAVVITCFVISICYFAAGYYYATVQEISSLIIIICILVPLTALALISLCKRINRHIK